MVTIWIETGSACNLAEAFSVMENKDQSRTNWGNLALLAAAAAALFHCISSLDSNSASFVGASWQDLGMNLGILCFAMLTLSILVSDRSGSKPDMTIYEHGEPRGFQPVKRRNSSISWADQK